MKFKKFLAVMLSAAMMVTSVNVTGLADLTTVLAADKTTDGTNYTFKISGNHSVQYGDTVTLTGNVARKDDKTNIVNGKTIYSWTVADAEGKTVAFTQTAEKPEEISFKAIQAAGKSYKVSLSATQVYTEGTGDKAVEKTETGSVQDFTVTVDKKVLQKSEAEVASPSFNKVYLEFNDADGKMTLKQLIDSNPVINTDNRGVWSIELAKDDKGNDISTKTYLEPDKDSEITLKYTINNSNYIGYVNAKDAKDTNNWENNATTFTRKVKFQVLSAKRHATNLKIVDPSNTKETKDRATLVYHDNLTQDVDINKTDFALEYDVAYDTKKETEDEALTAAIAEDGGYFNLNYDESLIKVTPNWSKKTLSVTALKANAKAATIEITDKAGIGIKKIISIDLRQGILAEEKTAFSDEIASTDYTLTPDTLDAKRVRVNADTVANIFPTFTAKNKEYTDKKSSVSYTVSSDGEKAVTSGDSKLTAASTKLTFTKIYDLNKTADVENNKPIEVKLTKTTQDNNGVKKDVYKPDYDANTLSTTKVVNIKKYNYTADDIAAAIDSITVSGKKLNGGTIPYGTSLLEEFGDDSTYTPSAFADLRFTLYYADNELKVSQVEKKSGAANLTPAVGKNEGHYLLRVNKADENDDNVLAEDLKKAYNVNFTVEAKNLGAIFTYKDGSNEPIEVKGAKTIQSKFKEDVVLTANPDAYNGASDSYDYTYQWYKNGAAIKDAESNTYTLTGNAKTGDYHCVIKAALKKDKTGNLGALEATTPVLSVKQTAIQVFAYTDDNGTIKHEENELSISANNVDYIQDAIKGVEIDGATKDATGIVEKGFQVQANGSTVESAELILTGEKTKVEKSFPVAEANLGKSYCNLTANTQDLDPDTYIMTVKAKAKGNAVEYNAVVGKFTITPFLKTADLLKDATNYTTAGKSFPYGTKLADGKLIYNFALPAKKRSPETKAILAGYSEAQISLIESKIKASYDSVAVSNPKLDETAVVVNEPLEVGKYTLTLTPKAGANVDPKIVVDAETMKTVATEKATALEITKKEVQLSFDSDSELIWVQGTDKPVASYKDKDVKTGKDLKEVTGLGKNVQYRFFTDADGKNEIAETKLTILPSGQNYWIQAYEDANTVTDKNYKSKESDRIKFVVAITRTGIAAKAASVIIKAGDATAAIAAETSQIEVIAAPEGAQFEEGETFTYTSSDPTIATVDEKGVITAVKVGAAEVTVQVIGKDGKAIEGQNTVVKVSVIAPENTKLPKTQEEYDKAIEAAKKEATAAAEKAAQEKIDEANTAKAVAEKAQKDAEDAKAKAEADKAAAETAKTAAEEAKTKAEEAQKAAETAKTKAEEEKDAAVTDKLAAEAAQKTAEAEKATAEAAQKAAEADKAVAEAAKTAAEKAQADAEAAQKAAETKAAEAETAKAVAETKLADAEAAKAAAEADKAAAEAAKTAAEADKAAAEAAKTAAEADKAAAEAAKTKAEADKADAEAAKAAAETAKAEAETKAVEAKEAQEKAEAAQKEAETKASESSKKVAVKKGQLVVYKNNIYKVTNVSKKTLTFVGTMSTAKTITIAKSVKIDGTSYKVTAIAKNALKGNKTAKKVVIPNTVKSIGKKAFANMNKNLKFKASAKVKKLANKAK